MKKNFTLALLFLPLIAFSEDSTEKKILGCWERTGLDSYNQYAQADMKIESFRYYFLEGGKVDAVTIFQEPTSSLYNPDANDINYKILRSGNLELFGYHENKPIVEIDEIVLLDANHLKLKAIDINGIQSENGILEEYKRCFQ